MANKKQIQVTKIGDFSGPFQNGKFENWEAPATVKDDKGSQEVVISVGSKGMADKMKPGSYLGFFAGKTDDNKWKVVFLAADNEGLGAPKKDGFGGSGGGYKGGSGGGGGGYTRNPDDGSMACACGLVKSLIETKVIKTVEESLEALKEAFIGVKAIMAESLPKHETTAHEHKEEAKDVMTDIRKAIGDVNLETEVRKAGCTVKQLKDLWDKHGEDADAFIENLEQLLIPKEDATDKDTPF